MQGWKSETGCQSNNNKNGNGVRVINDAEVASSVVEISCSKSKKSSFIIFPDSSGKFIGSPYPFLVMQIKNMQKFVSMEFDILDDANKVRTIHTSNKQSLLKIIDQSICTLPLSMDDGWNLIVIDLQSLCMKIFKTQYKYCMTVKIFANCRLRRIYFSRDLYQENELPEDYQVFGKRNPLLITKGARVIYKHQ